MAGKRRRLSQASVYRYYLKRLSMNLGTAGHVNADKIAGDPEVMRAVTRTSYYETYDWLTDYQPSHLAKEVAKEIAQKHNVPTALQGLLMAYAEKVTANYLLEWKNETLVEMHQNFLKELTVKSVAPGTGTVAGWVYSITTPSGKTITVDLSVVLTDIEKALMSYVKS